MEWLVTGWCNLIGIEDLGAIQVATGIVAVLLLIGGA